MIMRSKFLTRWTINLALKTAADIFRVKSHVDSQDIYEVSLNLCIHHVEKVHIGL